MPAYKGDINKKISTTLLFLHAKQSRIKQPFFTKLYNIHSFTCIIQTYSLHECAYLVNNVNELYIYKAQIPTKPILCLMWTVNNAYKNKCQIQAFQLYLLCLKNSHLQHVGHMLPLSGMVHAYLNWFHLHAVCVFLQTQTAEARDRNVPQAECFNQVRKSEDDSGFMNVDTSILVLSASGTKLLYLKKIVKL